MKQYMPDKRIVSRIRAEATAALCSFAENLTIGGKGARFTPQLKEARRAAARKESKP